MAHNHRLSRQRWIQKIKLYYGCQLCPERSLICLTFHHLDKLTKNHKICKCLSNFSKKLIRNEINLCVVLCLNCHAKVEAGALTVSMKKKCRIGADFRIEKD